MKSFICNNLLIKILIKNKMIKTTKIYIIKAIRMKRNATIKTAAFTRCLIEDTIDIDF